MNRKSDFRPFGSGFLNLFCTVILLLANSNLWGQTISFSSSGLSGESLNNPTSLQFGPDDRLYVSQQNGFIYAYDIVRNGVSDYAVTNAETIDKIRTIPNHNQDGSLYNNPARQVTGILAGGTATNPVLYVTSSDPRIGGGGSGNSTGLDENSGVISKLTWNGSDWDMVHLVRGLPRSEENHATNGLQWDASSNSLFVASGGHTNKGAPSNNFAYLPEFALSAAILKVDLTTIEALPTLIDAAGQAYKYDLPTLDDEDQTNVSNPTAGFEDPSDPFGGNNGKNQAMLVQGGPVQVYSSGWRNHYDVCLTSTGRLYTFDNGPNTGWGGIPAAGCTNASNEANSNSTCDNLHFVNGQGYYGGHPNPTRANRANTFNASNPQTPIPAGMEDTNCAYLNPGTQDGALATVCSSTNGLCEYTATNFNGALQGNLLAAAFNGTIYSFELNAAGDAVVNQQSLFSGFGATPLDVVAQPDAGPFPGTVWACTYGSDNITIFEPQDFVVCVGNNTSYVFDFDNDGYSNGDELDNGTDQCSPASTPPDFDGDFVSDLNDNDDDNDLILDNVDLFARDANNGVTTGMPVDYQFDNSIDPGINGWGFTGLMTNYSDDYMDLYDDGQMTVGGAALKFTVDDVPAGDAYGTANDQEYAFQFGVNVANEINNYALQGRIQGYFGGQTPVDFQSQGIYLGTGDQDNYLKLAMVANGGSGGFQVTYEESAGGFGGSGNPVETLYPVSGLNAATFTDLYLEVDPNANTVQPGYSQNGGAIQNLGTPIAVPASWLNGVMATGFISTSRGSGGTFPATYDFITVTRQPNTSAGQWVDVIPNSGSAQSRHENSFVQVGDKFYLIGGRGNRRVDIYDPIAGSWSTGATPPVQMHHFQGIEYEGNLWVVGAFTGGYPNETPVPNIYIYNPATDSWHQGPEIPAARRRGSAGIVVYNDEVYMVCGIQNGHVNGWVPWVDKFNPSTGTWTVLADAPIQRDHYHAAIADGKIFNAGGRRTGFNGSVFNSTVDQVDVYDIAGNSWNTLSAASNIPTPRAGAMVGVIGDELIVAGGESGSQGAGHEETEALHVHDHTWRSLDNMIDGRHGTSAIVNNSVMYVAAGSGNRGGGPELNSMEALSFFGMRPATDGYAIQASSLLSNPTSHDFGTVTVSQTATQSFVISNSNGNQGIFLTDVNLTGASVFSHNFVGSLPLYLPAGASLTIDVTYAPTGPGNSNGVLVLENTGGTSPLAIPLNGGANQNLALYRINSNGPDYTNVNGDLFSADAFFTGGQSTNNSGLAIANTTDDALYQLYRYGQFSYDFPVPSAGNYQVILHFSENWNGANGIGLRVFDVEAEGSVALNNYDIWATAGYQTAIQETLVVNVQDGNLDLDWVAITQNPKVAAIEVLGPVSAGEAELAATPDPLHFFSQLVGTTSASQDLSLSNGGNQDSSLTISGVAIGGPNAGEFAFTGSLPVSLTGSNVLDLPFTFTPAGPGLRNAYIVVTHDGLNSPDTIPLTGEGVLPTFSVSINVLDTVLCAGDQNGELEAMVSNGQGPFVYSWSTGSTSNIVSGLGTGSYTVTVTDFFNQSATANYVIGTTVLVSNADACLENGLGTISVQTSGGTAPYGYLWSTNAGSSTNDSVVGLANGAYTVTVTDANGCESISSVSVSSNTASCDTCALPQNWANQDIGAVAATGKTCYDAVNDIWYVDGSGADIWGGADEFQYAYTSLSGDGEFIAQVTNITNTNQWAKAGIMMRDDLSPGSPNVMMLKRGGAGLSFQWRNTANANSSFTGGQSIPTFPVYLRMVRQGNTFTAFHSGNGTNWTQLGASQTVAMGQTIFVGLAVTSHNDGVINNSTFENVELIPSNPLMANAIVTSNFNGADVSCFGAADGSAQVSPSQGVFPYAYTWDAPAGNQTTAQATGLAAGTYSVTVTDANSNQVVASVTLGQPSQVVASAIETVQASQGQADGAAQASATGGTGAYTYLWDAAAANQTTAVATGLAAGTYSVTITDANGCSEVSSVTISEYIFSMRINSGGPQYIAVNGDTFVADVLFTSGNPFQNNGATITGTLDPNLYKTERYGNPLNYAIPVPNPGLYELRFHFAEIYNPNNSAGARVFDVNAEGNLLIDDLDLVAQYGQYVAAVQTFAISVTDGVLNIEAPASVDNAKISAIEVISLGPIPLSVALNPSAFNCGNGISCNGANDGSLVANVSGGQAPYSFAWSANAGGSTLASLSNLQAGTYVVTITDANGDQVVDSVQLSEPAAIALTMSGTDLLCFGDANGTASVAVTGGCPPYSIQWDAAAANQTTAVAANLAAGNYGVTVTDANGCSSGATVVLVQPSQLTVNAVQDQAATLGNSDGSASVSATGGLSPYAYQWDVNTGNQTSAIASNLGAGTYSVSVTDANGCVAVDSVEVEELPLEVRINAGGPNYTTTGNLLFVADNGFNTGNTYTNNNVNIVGTSDPDLYKTERYGANFSYNIPISNGLYQVNLHFAEIYIGANGGGNGGVGSRVFDVSLENQAVLSNFDIFAEVGPEVALVKTYYVNITDGAVDLDFTAIANNAKISAIEVVQVTTAPALLVETVVDTFACGYEVSCNGASDANIAVNATGGAIPYSYLWNTGSTNPNLSGVGAGQYTVTATDGIGQVSSVNVVIQEPAPLSITATIGDVSCNGLADGSIGLVIVGGCSPYDIQWGPNAGSSTASSIGNLVAGTYAVQVTDANGCGSNQSFTVGEPAQLALSYTPSLFNCGTNVSCNAALDGSITANPSGGTGPYNLIWGSGVEIRFNCGGPAFTAANGDQYTADQYFTSPSNTYTNNQIPNILGTNDDILYRSERYRNAFSYQVPLANGNYQVVLHFAEIYQGATGGNGNGGVGSRIFNVSIEGNAFLSNYDIYADVGAETSVTKTTLVAVIDGQLDIDFNSVVDNAKISAIEILSVGGTGNFLNGLGAGNYPVTLTDANGCSLTETVVLTEPTPVVATTSLISGIACQGDASGIASANVSGGCPPYAYQWSANAQNQTTAQATGLGAGTFGVTVTDANGCTASSNIVITEPAALSATALATDATCAGINDGTIDVTVNGGTAPYSFAWNNSASSEDLTGLGVGTYSVVITDINGCQTQTSGAIAAPQALSLVATPTDLLCQGDQNGALDLSVTGGTVPYTFAWSNNSTNEDLSGLSAGSYGVVVTDANGCIGASTFAVAEPALLTAQVNATNVSCNGAADGSIDLQVAGGTAPHTFQWSTGAVSEDLQGLPQGTYSVTVTDANNCTANASVIVTEPAAMNVFATVVQGIPCGGANVGIAEASATGGNLPFSFQWDSNAGSQSTALANNLASGTYSVTVTDSRGCQGVTSVTISAAPVSILVDGTDITCFGANDGNIQATGGSAPYTYSITPQSNVLSQAIGFGRDDAEEDQNGVVRLGNPDLEMAYDNANLGNQVIGLRFRNLGIPQGATIVSASLQFTTKATNNRNPSNLSIQAEAADNSGLFQNTSGNLSARNRTVALVGWSPANWTQVGQSGSDQETPDLSTLVQEVVNRGGWSAGNAMSFLVSGTGRRNAWSRNGSPNDAAELLIEYYVGNPLNSNQNVPAGTYSVIATDANGCTGVGTVTIVEPAPLTATTFGIDPLCTNGSDGYAWVVTTGGTQPYSNLWGPSTGFQSGDTASGLAAGFHLVEVTDANNCRSVSATTLNNPLPLLIQANDISCNGELDGEFTAQGGILPYTWSVSSQVSQSLDVPIRFGRDDAEERQNGSVNRGNNDLELVYDGANNGNQVIGLIFRDLAIPQGATVTNAYVQFTAKNTGNLNPSNLSISAQADDNAALFTNAANGLSTRPLTNATVAWNPGNWSTVGQAGTDEQTPNLSALLQEVVNRNGWSSGNRIALLLSGQGRRRAFSFNGSVAGAPVLHVEWTLNNSQQTTGLAAGTYSVTLTDFNGCTASQTLTINEPAELLVNPAVVAQPSSPNAADGEAIANLSGGTSPYTYQWDANAGSQTTATAIGLGQGSYNVTVTDSRGCIGTGSVTLVSLVPPLVVSAADSGAILCAGDADGIAIATATGGQAPYNYLWSTNTGSQTTATATGLAAGTYSVTITDALSDTSSASVTLQEPGGLTLQGQDVTCAGGNDGSVLANGGIAPYTYSIGAGTGNVSVRPTATLDDAEQAIVGGSMNVTSPNLEMGWDNNDSSDPQLVGIRFENVNIPQGATITGASLTFNAFSGNSQASSLNFVGEAADNALAFSNATNNIGSRANTAASVNWSVPAWVANQDYTSPDLSTVVQEVVARGGWNAGNDLAILISGSGFRDAKSWNANPGQAPLLEVSWTLNSSNTGLTVGTYPFTVTDANGCQYTDTITIGEPAPLSLVGNAPSCGGTGSVLGTGGTAPYTLNLLGIAPVSSRVRAGINDGEQALGNGAMNIVSTSLEMGWDNNDASDPQLVGMVFDGINVPQGATITSATLTFTALTSETNSCSLQFQGQAADQASSLNNANSNLSNRPLTNASVAWNNVPAWSANQTYVAPDLSSIVQEVVNRGGWTAGNALYLQVAGSGMRNAKSYESNSTQAPLLEVTYSMNISSGTDSLSGLVPGTYTIGMVDANGCSLTNTLTLEDGCNPCIYDRVTNGLLVLYPFAEGSGNTVHDLGGFGAPLDLTIADPGNVTWQMGNGLLINSGTILASAGPATKVYNACVASEEITIEAWVDAANTTQGGPSRIATMSVDPYNRDWTLGQEGSSYMARLRTSTSAVNGTPDLTTGTGEVSGNLQHVVMTNDAAGNWTLYVDGAVEASGTRTGSFAGWNPNYPLALANELTNDRPWLGGLKLVAVYDRALSPVEIAQNLAVGAECPGNFPPVAYCAVEVNACDQPLTVEFDGSASVDSDGNLISYLWDFGDGNGATTPAAVHNYAAAGSYLTSLIVVDDQGGRDTCSSIVTVTSTPGSRVGNGLIAYYTFTETSGNVVHDFSGFGSPLDLTIADTNNVTWLANSALSIDQGTIISSLVPANKIATACAATNELSIEAWVAPDNLSQGGPTRIVTYSVNTASRNWTLGQEGDEYISRLRTTATNNQGTPDLTTANGPVSTGLQHLVFTRDANGVWNLYIDGAIEASGVRGGNLSNWDTGYEFALVNELTNDRAWLGEMHLVAVYDQALTSAEVQQNLLVGPDCIGNLAPTAQFATGQDLCGSDTLMVDGSTSLDPDGTIVSYAWDFGDGNTALGAVNTHVYSTPGTYTVVLTVTDNDGAIDTYAETVNALGQGGRVTAGLVALYPFMEATGDTVHDYSGFGTPLDLTIADPSNVSWLTGNVLAINSGTIIKSDGPATKLRTACQATNEVTLEAWVKPANTTQGGPTRIASFSVDTGNRNWTLGQEGDEYLARLRTTVTSNQGMPDLSSSNGPVTTQLQHVVFTRNAGGSWNLYVDGVLEETGNRGGDFSNWDANYEFALVNELTNDRDWLGELHLVAVYNEALSPVKVLQNYAVGPDCFDNFPASAQFSVTQDLCVAASTVDLDASASQDIDGSIVSYAWNFGDGSTANGALTSHTYAALGNFTVILTLTDDDGAVSTATQTVTAYPAGGRSTTDLVALYQFDEGTGNQVLDVSGVGTPLNLTIANPGNVSWLTGGGLSVNSATTIASTTSGAKITTAAQASNELTVEAWVKPANTSQNGPARMVSLSSNTSDRNFTLGQQNSQYSGRIRSTTTGNNGTPDGNTGNVVSTTNLQHVVMTRNAAGQWLIYLDGQVAYSGTRTGNFSNWSGNYFFALANELTNDRPWLGELHLVAVYSSSLSAAEVNQHYTVGPHCGGNASKAVAGSEPEVPSLEHHSVEVFPNPFRDAFKLRFEAISSVSELDIRVYDLRGVEVVEQVVTPDGGLTWEGQIRMDHLTAGNYFLVVRAGDFTRRIMVVKQ